MAASSPNLRSIGATFGIYGIQNMCTHQNDTEVSQTRARCAATFGDWDAGNVKRVETRLTFWHLLTFLGDLVPQESPQDFAGCGFRYFIDKPDLVQLFIGRQIIDEMGVNGGLVRATLAADDKCNW